MRPRTYSARLGLIAAAATLVTACTTSQDMYYWGNYERSLYESYVKAGEVDPVKQIETLNADIEQAANNGKPVPPGVYAHLGMIYASVGQLDAAVAALNAEKALFPESRVLIDGMIARATQQGAD
jgi:hypothetical protein